MSALRHGFGINDTSVYHRMHREAIDAWVDDQLTTLPLRAEANKRLPDLLHPSVRGRSGTSRSLSPSTASCSRTGPLPMPLPPS